MSVSEIVGLVDCCHGCICDSLGARRGTKERYLYNAVYLCGLSFIPLVLMSWTIFAIVIPFSCWIMVVFDLLLYFKIISVEEDAKGYVSRGTYQIAIYIQLVFSLLMCAFSIIMCFLFIGLFVASFFITIFGVLIISFAFSLIFVPVCCMCGLIPVSLQTAGLLKDWKSRGTELDFKRYNSVKASASLMCGITCSVFISFILLLIIGGVGFALYSMGITGGGIGSFLGI